MNYRHLKSGGEYELLLVGHDEATLNPMVIYRSLDDEEIWCRPAKEFFDGRFVPINERLEPRSDYEN
jgi:hypothetical protein